MKKKILWTALVTTRSTLSAALAARAAGSIWTAIAKEPPPRAPGWAKWLVGKPLGSAMHAG